MRSLQLSMKDGEAPGLPIHSVTRSIHSSTMLFSGVIVTLDGLGNATSAGIVSAFDHYSAERHPHVARLQQAGRRMRRFAVSSGWVGHLIINTMTRVLMKQRPWDRQWNYVLKYAIADPL